MKRMATFSKWWKVGETSIYGKNEGENTKIAEIETERFDFQKQDVDDCARLIAHAPELFEQLKEMHLLLFAKKVIGKGGCQPSIDKRINDILVKGDKLINEISCEKGGEG